MYHQFWFQKLKVYLFLFENITKEVKFVPYRIDIQLSNSIYLFDY